MKGAPYKPKIPTSKPRWFGRYRSKPEQVDSALNAAFRYLLAHGKHPNWAKDTGPCQWPAELHEFVDRWLDYRSAERLARKQREELPEAEVAEVPPAVQR